MAATAVSMLPWPEIITTGSSGWISLTESRSCRPSSLLPCSQMSRNTRLGRRFLISFKAASLSRAVRVPSASSSTMRISDGIGLSLAGNFGFIEVRNGLGGSAHILGRVGGGHRALDLRLDPQAHPGAALAGEFLRGVAQFDAAAMVFENAADDSEAKAG